MKIDENNDLIGNILNFLTEISLNIQTENGINPIQ